MSPLELLLAYRPADLDDERTLARFIDFVTHHTDCLERSLAIGHVTASAWVVDPTGSHVVLVHHRKLSRWLQPGGHADGHSELETVARREIAEETGLTGLVSIAPVPFDLDIHAIPQFRKVPAHEHFDVRFAFRVTGNASLRQSSESHEVTWIPINQLEAYDPDSSILRMREKWRQATGGGQSYPKNNDH